MHAISAPSRRTRRLPGAVARGGPLWHVGDVTDQAAPTLAPRDWSAEPADVLLADGTVAVIRSLREDDRDAVLGLHESVSVDTLRLRFFSPSREAGRLYVDHLFAPDNTASAALVALVRGRVAGLATAELLSPGTAEVAFLVADEDRGRGLGSLLLEHLAALGRRHGVSRFEAEVLGDNYGMLRVFRAAGFGATRRTVAGRGGGRAAHRRLPRGGRGGRPAGVARRRPVAPAAAAPGERRRGRRTPLRGRLRARRARRDPQLGLRRRRCTWCTPRPTSIDGLPTVRSLADLDGPVDLVVVAVPADGVADVLRDAAANGAGRRGRHLVGLLRQRERRASPRAAHPGPRAQPPPGRPQLAGRAGQRRRPQRDAPPRRARGGRPRRRLPVGRHGLRAARPRPRRRASGCRPSSRSATRSTCRATTCSRPGWTTTAVAAGALYLESFGNALKFARTARRFAEQKPLLAVVGRPLAGPAGPDRLLDRRRRRRRAARPVGGDRLPDRRRADRDRAAARAAAAAGRAPGVHRLQHRRRGRPHDRPCRRPGHGRRADVVRPERRPARGRAGRGRRPQPGRPRSRRHARPSSPPRCAPCSTRARPTPSW